MELSSASFDDLKEVLETGKKLPSHPSVERALGQISGHLGISHEQCKYRLKRASTALRKVLLNDFSLEKMADTEGYLQKTSNG